MRPLLTALLLAANPAQAAPATLTLSAPVGTSVTLSTRSETRVVIGDVRASRVPGAKVTDAQLQQAQREFSQGVASANQSAAVGGQLTSKVTGRSPDGTTTLVSSVTQQVPGQAAVVIRVTQRVSPSGAVSGLKLDSDNPQLRAAFARLSPAQLQQFAGQQGAASGVYGQPLTPGNTRSRTVTQDVQALIGNMVAAVAGPQGAAELGGKVQATPLTVTARTTYTGRTAQGLHAFSFTSAAKNWQVRVGGGQVPAVGVTLRDLSATGTQTYTAGGLPGPGTTRSTTRMEMVTEMNGIRMTFTMTLNQTMTMTAR